MSTEKEFTQGKWYYKFSPISQVSPNGQFTVKAGDVSRPICIVPLPIGGINGKEKQEANAKLIAAAPELLEISIKCLQWCNSAMSPEFVNKLRIEALSAIKKATE